MKNPALAYRQFSVQGSTPLGLVVMLYDGAIAYLQRAITAIDVHDTSKKCAQLNRAQAIIMQLEGTLNFEVGGEVAQTLKALYVYARAQMLKANIDNSSEVLRSLIEKLSTVREAWSEADHRPPAAPPTSATEASSQEGRYKTPYGQQASPFKPTIKDSPYAPSTDMEPGSLRLTA
jgi:flagellar secretion chaperone FliS